jgi:hypothetical protein
MFPIATVVTSSDSARSACSRPGASSALFRHRTRNAALKVLPVKMQCLSAGAGSGTHISCVLLNSVIGAHVYFGSREIRDNRRVAAQLQFDDLGTFRHRARVCLHAQLHHHRILPSV